MMAETVLFQAGMGNHDEIWDDSLLIQQYDEAMQNVKEKVTQRITGSEANSEATEETKPNKKSNRRKRKAKKKNNQWSVGNYCRCVYDVDGLEYEGIIRGITEDYATVEFLGYNDTQETSLEDLMKSRGKSERDEQIKSVLGCENAEEYAEGCLFNTENNEDSNNSNDAPPFLYPDNKYSPSQKNMAPPPTNLHHDMFPPPPPPPGLPVDDPLLHTMLMSWYMTGYHTGYYKGVMQSRSSPSSRRNRR